MRFIADAVRLCAAVAGLTVVGSMANAAAPVPAGKRAMLSLNIEVDGAGQRVSKSNGIDMSWSTRRRLEARIEVVADAPGKFSQANAAAQGAAYKQSTSMEALQKEAQKCGADDTACQMAVAMKMMETDDAKQAMQQAVVAQSAPARYQLWKPAAKGGRADVKAEYKEQWDGVFLTASREVRNCKIDLPAVSALSAEARDNLAAGFRGLSVEIDTQTGKNWLMAAMAFFAQGEVKCHINDGGRVSDKRENKTLNFNAPIDTKSNGGWVAGGTPAGAAIARGELNFDTKPDAQAQSGVSVTAPLKVKMRWELTPL